MGSTWEDGIGALGDQREAARAAAGQEGFGWWVTPGQVDAKVRELGAAFDAFQASVLAYVPPTQRGDVWAQWRAGWVGFYAAWEAFRRQLETDTLTRNSGSTAEMILHYQDRLAQWQAEFQRKWSGQIAGPMVDRPDPQKGSSGIWRTIGIGVAIGVGTGVVLWTLRSVLAKP
jgi:hypothetical protein